MLSVYSERTNQPPTGDIELENFDQTNQPPTGDIELENFANENSHDDDDFDEDDDCGYEDYTRGDDLVEAEIHLYVCTFTYTISYYVCMYAIRERFAHTHTYMNNCDRI